MKNSIPPSKYNKKYLLSENLEGYKEYTNGSLSKVKRDQIQLLKISSKTKILDIGLGRGELLRECAKKGASTYGIDYSKDAVSIAKETLSKYKKAKVILADSRKLPFNSNLFSRVFCGDVIEHMSFADAVKTVKEINRVLSNNGFALIHTSPNKLFINITYPILKLPLRIFFPSIYHGMEKTAKVRKMVHVYEYNYFTLKKLANKSGIQNNKVWIDSDLLRSGSHRHTKSIQDSWIGRVVKIFGKFWGVKILLGNDLYLKFKKQ